MEEWQDGVRTRPENVLQGEKTGSSCFLPPQLERREGRASLSQTCQAVRGGQPRSCLSLASIYTRGLPMKGFCSLPSCF